MLRLAAGVSTGRMVRHGRLLLYLGPVSLFRKVKRYTRPLRRREYRSSSPAFQFWQRLTSLPVAKAVSQVKMLTRRIHDVNGAHFTASTICVY